MICSDEFGPLGRAEAQVLGMGGLPLLPIPHPLAGNDGALVRAKAEAIADERDFRFVFARVGVEKHPVGAGVLGRFLEQLGGTR